MSDTNKRLQKEFCDNVVTTVVFLLVYSWYRECRPLSENTEVNRQSFLQFLQTLPVHDLTGIKTHVEIIIARLKEPGAKLPAFGFEKKHITHL